MEILSIFAKKNQKSVCDTLSETDVNGGLKDWTKKNSSNWPHLAAIAQNLLPRNIQSYVRKKVIQMTILSHCTKAICDGPISRRTEEWYTSKMVKPPPSATVSKGTQTADKIGSINIFAKKVKKLFVIH